MRKQKESEIIQGVRREGQKVKSYMRTNFLKFYDLFKN